ncbi:MAG: hypothetical protein HBSAPP03_03370 [Phycisphaerae bacterium]|nr:MAG: hypothetical protein HBSAPP03_03370 [Phycisphaerae bacterium]
MGDEHSYDLVRDAAPKPPRLRGQAIVRPDSDALIDALLADLFIHAGNCVRTFGDCHIAIDGCPSIEPVLRRLLYDPAYREFPWARTRVWMVREWNGLSDGRASAWDLIREMIVEQSGIPVEQAHPLEAWASDGAARYTSLLREHLGWRAKGHDRLDVVLLALGDDGDLAGLRWPSEGSCDGLCAARTTRAGVVEVGLTATCLNAARFIGVYAAGAGVAAPLRHLDENLRRPPGEREAAPGLALSPTGGELRWYLDYAACRGA